MRMTYDDSRVRKLTQAMFRQVPFAASKAVNELALTAQREIRAELPQHFTLRRRDFIERAIKMIQFAKKQAITAILGVAPVPRSGIDQAMSRQEFGGSITPKDGGAVAEPLSGARPTPTSITTPSIWPSKLKRKFTVVSKGKKLILQRVGSSPRKTATHGPVQAGKDPHVRVMYELERAVPVHKRWNFIATCRKVVARDYKAAFTKALADAIRTAR